MYALSLHEHLIGRQGSRSALNTPALIVDVDALASVDTLDFPDPMPPVRPINRMGTP